MSWKGTPVPNSGTCPDMYLNTNLSVEEVKEILNTIDYIEMEGESLYWVLYGEYYLGAVSSMANIIISKVDNDYGVVLILGTEQDASTEIVFSSNSQIYGFEGWSDKFDDAVIMFSALDMSLNNNFADLNVPVGKQNNKLSSLFSTTSFKKVPYVPTLNEWATDIANAIREKKGIESKEEWVGTEVSDSDEVNSIYFNTNLSNEEVYDYLSIYLSSTNVGYTAPIMAFSVSINGTVQEEPLLIMVNVSSMDSTKSKIYIQWEGYSDVIIWSMDNGWSTDFDDSTNLVNMFKSMHPGVEYKFEAINELEGFPVGQYNEHFRFLISSTPIEKKTTGLIPRLNFAQEIRSIETGNDTTDATATAVPISGMVEKVYLNFNQDVNEIMEIVKGLSYVQVPGAGNVYPIISNADMSVVMYIGKVEDERYFLTTRDTKGNAIYVAIYWFDAENQYVIRLNGGSEGEGEFVYNQPLEFGFENMVGALSAQFPDYVNSNELLKKMISITPIQKIESGSSSVGYKGTTVPNSGTVSKVYLNTSLSVEEVVSLVSELNYYSKDDIGGNSDIAFLLGSNSQIIVVSREVDSDSSETFYQIYDYSSPTKIYFISSDIYANDGLNSGWQTFDNPITIGEEVLSSGTINVPIEIGAENDKLSSLFSITPFEVVSTEEFVKECSTAVLEAKGEEIEWEGTPVPNSGTIEKVYFNTKLSNDEIKELIDSLTYSWTNTDYSKGLIVADNGEDLLLVIMKQRTDTAVDFDYIIQLIDNSKSGDEQFTTYWSNNEGWVTSEIVLDMSLVSETEGIPVGEQNDKLSSLISTTKFIAKNSIYPTLIPDEIRKLSSGGSGIIEVDELPTENIDENAVYKIPKKFVDGYAINTGVSLTVSDVCSLTTEIVNDKPTSNIIESDVSATVPVMHLYYVLNENDIFIYTNIGNGLMWVSIGQVLPNMIPYFQGITFKGETETTNFFPIYVSDDSYKQEFYGYYAVVKPEQYYKYLNNKWYKFDSNNYSDYYLDSISYASSKIVVPSRIKVLRPYAFYHHPRVEQIVIEDGLIAIEESAISWSYYLKSVVIGKGIKSIHSSNFYNCEQLTDIYFKGTQEEWNAIDTPGGNDLPSNVTYHFNYVEE